jgi:dolichyl-phosphate-mannose--protein O-mannosyl transferase
MLDVTATIERPLGSPPPVPASAEVTAQADELRERLVPAFPSSGLRGWLGPLLVTALAFFLRIWHISTPRAFSFDETYYAKDAWSLLHFGYERQPVPNADKIFLSGDGHVFGSGSEWATHPPLGKWVIAVGEEIWGITPFGYRIMAVVFGTASVLVLARTARRMFRSDLLGSLAGLLLALDGLAIVMSRTSMLDIFLMAFVLFAFACLVIDRDRVRALMLEWSLASLTATSEPGPPPRRSLGPRLGLRPWRLTAAFFLGCACATKWSGVYYLVGFAALSWLWDRSARKAAGVQDPTWAAVARDSWTNLLSFFPLAIATYTASYTGWFVTKGGYLRNWADTAGAQTAHGWVPGVLRSWWHWHAVTLNYHNHLFSPHAYEAGPGKWIIMARPTQMYAVYPKCPSNPTVDCARDIVSLGNPIIWWTGCVALLWCLWLLFTRWDWRAGAALMGLAAGWLPWFENLRRTTFTTYAVIFVPYLCLALVVMLASVIGPPRASPARRTVGAAVAGSWLLVVLVISNILYPVWTAELITRAHWNNLMWFRSWI